MSDLEPSDAADAQPADVQPADVPPADAQPADAPADPTTGAAFESGASSQVLVTIGDIACTQTEVLTPNGRRPLKSTNWIVTNNSRTTEKIPTYAIVLAIVLAFACLLGLLFLLVKEQVTEGNMQVSVQGDDFYYSTTIQVSSPEQVTDVEQRVNYARGLVRALAE